MKSIGKYKWLINLVLLVSAGFLFLYYQYYHRDIKTLKDFIASYEKYDNALSDFSLNMTDKLESIADDALIELVS
jgi:hypothetical protein